MEMTEDITVYDSIYFYLSKHTELFWLSFFKQNRGLQGRIQDFSKGGSLRSSYAYSFAKQNWHAKHAHSRGVWGHDPPGNF